jgi:hypothetical protein
VLRRDFLAALLAAGVGPELADRLAHRKIWPVRTNLVVVPLSRWYTVTVPVSGADLKTLLLSQDLAGKLREADRALQHQVAMDIDAALLSRAQRQAVEATSRETMKAEIWYDPRQAGTLMTVSTLYGLPGDLVQEAGSLVKTNGGMDGWWNMAKFGTHTFKVHP